MAPSPILAEPVVKTPVTLPAAAPQNSIMPPTGVLSGHPAPPITSKIFVTRSPVVVAKDKSTHSEHGVIYYPFWYGGAASAVSSVCTQPFGVATLRLQTQPHDGHNRNLLSMWKHIVHGEGFQGLWRGLSASLTRVAFYSTIRFGAYEKIKERCTTTTHAPSPVTLAAIGAFSGFTGSVIGNFADVVCARMQNDLAHPPEKRYNYRNVVHGLQTMVRAEGWESIWRGVWINASRCGLSTITMLAGYDVIKRNLLATETFHDGVPLHITSSLASGFLTTIICNPIDVIKARVITAHSDHMSVHRALRRAVKAEGTLWMFKGLLPASISRVPSTIIIFVVLEQLKALYRRKNNLEE